MFPPDSILGDLDILKARVVTILEEDYPPNLKSIYDPSSLLYIIGESFYQWIVSL